MQKFGYLFFTGRDFETQNSIVRTMLSTGDKQATFLHSNKREITMKESAELNQNYPNPFNPSTTIEYTIPGCGSNETRNVSLNIYDIMGNLVTRLVNEDKLPGTYKTKFIAGGISGGVYVYELKVGDFTSVKHMVLQK